MASKHERENELRRWCAETGPEDGQDPRDFFRNCPRRTSGRKALQLCRQVERALHWALAECGDPVLQALEVAAVEPAPHSGRLLVVVKASGDEHPQANVLARLASAAGLLRAEVGREIHRRKVPELTFTLIET